ncbi:membrane protein [Pseudomonas avellanae]|uniref:COG4705 family protein n=1 Tax=Pseudomonas avellanae TaxID=46257 RepID=UPI000417A21F|nr:membrane protein [Pseudomonas avellanae]
MNKLPQITLAFWIMKICATTLGETAGDLLSMTLNVGYALSSLILIGLFAATLVTQLASRRYHPMLYWLVILSTSTAGTTMSDFMDRTLGLGYAMGSTVLIAMLIAVFCAWYASEKSLSVDKITTLKGEVFYWVAILISNTLGTAVGDYLADDSGMGFAGGALLIGSAIALVVVLHYTTRLSSIMLFWGAFVLTRPFGATLGDVLTKPHEKGGLDFGTVGSSAVLLAVLLLLVGLATYYNRNRKTAVIDNRLPDS